MPEIMETPSVQQDASGAKGKQHNPPLEVSKWATPILHRKTRISWSPSLAPNLGYARFSRLFHFGDPRIRVPALATRLGRTLHCHLRRLRSQGCQLLLGAELGQGGALQHHLTRRNRTAPWAKFPDPVRGLESIAEKGGTCFVVLTRPSVSHPAKKRLKKRGPLEVWVQVWVMNPH